MAPALASRHIAGSSEAALLFEALQSELGDGPGLLAYESGEAVEVPDLASDTRFPEFGIAAVSAGYVAAFAFALQHGDSRIGSLQLFCDSVGLLDAEDLLAAQTLADVVSAYIANARARADAHDVSDRFRDSALRDALTDLPNRVLLTQRIGHAASRARRSRTQAALLVVSLERFEDIGDTHGNAIANSALIAVAERLAASVRPGDTLARVSRSEFVVLCEDLSTVRNVDTLTGRLSECFDPPFTVRDLDIAISAGIGIAFCGPGAELSSSSISEADSAMYEATHDGAAGRRVIDLREERYVRDRELLERELPRALAGSGLDVVYQPIVRTDDGQLVGAEALLRWNHSELGPVSTLTAISIAEQSGLIADVGAWVLDRACQDRAAWLAIDPHKPVHVAVNISGRQLLSAGFCETVAAVLYGTRTDPAALVLEVTEGVLIEEGAHALGVLADLKALGVGLALDNFGTGYCSLNYLRRFPVDYLKLDRTFVLDLDNDPVNRLLATSVTDLAHLLGITVVAEGVETEQQHDHAVSFGCPLAQGFYYGHPIPGADIPAAVAAGVRIGALH
jgi:diguanylate cyclase (GGDEF)-like protein